MILAAYSLLHTDYPLLPARESFLEQGAGRVLFPARAFYGGHRSSMISEIRIPKLGMTQSDITVVELSRKDGDRVEKDEKVGVI